ncbi:MAG: hypothetical protein R3E13_09445 [Alphaproteobacteria bacterium]
MDDKLRETVEKYHISLRHETDGVFALSDDPHDSGQYIFAVNSIPHLKDVYNGDAARLDIFSAAEKLAAEQQQEKLEAVM